MKYLTPFFNGDALSQIICVLFCYILFCVVRFWIYIYSITGRCM